MLTYVQLFVWFSCLMQKGFKCNDLQLKSAWELLGGDMDGNSIDPQLGWIFHCRMAGCLCPGYFIHVFIFAQWEEVETCRPSIFCQWVELFFSSWWLEIAKKKTSLRSNLRLYNLRWITGPNNKSYIRIFSDVRVKSFKGMNSVPNSTLLDWQTVWIFQTSDVPGCPDFYTS